MKTSNTMKMETIVGLREPVKAYYAGFLDGDGSILAQLVRRQDYVYKFGIRVSIVFYQTTKRH